MPQSGKDIWFWCFFMMDKGKPVSSSLDLGGPQKHAQWIRKEHRHSELGTDILN